MDSKIFSAYDIRGIYPEQWNEDDALLLGQAFGTYFQENGVKKVFLGKDNRVSSPTLSEKIIEGLSSTGCDIVDLGTIITPMIYFSWYHFDANATIMITASHNPSQYNGIKSSINKHVIFGEKIKEIQKIVLEKKFLSSTRGKIESADIITSYLSMLKEKIKLARPLNIAIDTANGTAGLFVEQIFTGLGCRVTSLYKESDGNFPNHQPYPQKFEYYSKLKETLQNGDFDFGLAFDGDGDRIGVYDKRGEYVQSDALAAILAKDVCLKNPNAKIVLNISTTLAVLEIIKKYGGNPMLWKTGYPNITSKMNEADATFGGEISGHFFFKDRYFGYDDAIYAALRLSEVVSSGQSLKESIDEIPKYPQTPEIRIQLKEGVDKHEVSKKIAEDLKTNYPQVQVLDIDGTRFTLGDGWGLLRASNTEPLLSARAEAKTEEGLEKIRGIINQQLEKQGIEERI